MFLSLRKLFSILQVCLWEQMIASWLIPYNIGLVNQVIMKWKFLPVIESIIILIVSIAIRPGCSHHHEHNNQEHKHGLHHLAACLSISDGSEAKLDPAWCLYSAANMPRPPHLAAVMLLLRGQHVQLVISVICPKCWIVSAIFAVQNNL